MFARKDDVEICFLLSPGQRVGVAGSMFIAPDSSLPFCGIVAAPWLFEPSRRSLSSNAQRKEWNNALLQTCYRAFDEVMAFLLETLVWGGLGWDGFVESAGERAPHRELKQA